MHVFRTLNKQDILLFIFFTLALFIIDKGVKHLIINNFIIYSDHISILPFLELRYILNSGVSFGWLNNLNYQLIIVISIISCAIAIYLVSGLYLNKSFEFILVLSLLLAGSVGNITDRISYRGVIDYIHFYIGNYSFPIFNLADCFITFSALIIIKNVIINIRKKK